MAEEKKEVIEDPCIVPHDWTVFQRINYVRSKVSYLQKDKDAGGYKAVTHDNVTGALRAFLVEAGLMIIPSLIKNQSVDSGSRTGKGIPIIRMETEWEVTFTCGRGDDVKMTVPAHGLDYGDKAPGKTASYAKKYAEVKMFDIETGEDDESRIEQKAADDIKREQEELRRQILSKAVAQHMDSIVAVKTGIKENNLASASEAWFELSNDEMKSIWAAPSKGGPFTIKEREIIRSREFRAAHFGEEHVATEEEIKSKEKADA